MRRCADGQPLLLGRIRPAVANVAESGDRSSKNYGFVAKVARENVLYSIRQIRERSPIINDLVISNKLALHV